eukprot:78345-Alexandrium_andersonii.AAC.1
MAQLADYVDKEGLGLLAFQEIRTPRNFQFSIGGSQFLLVGEAQRHGASKGLVEYAGVGFVVSSRSRRSVVAFRACSSRLAPVTIRAALRRLRVIAAYAPAGRQARGGEGGLLLGSSRAGLAP